MSTIAERLERLRMSVPGEVRIVAVSKTMPSEIVMEAYNARQRIFGENRVQEIISKKDQLPEDIEWHMIGHLQSNKVKTVVPFISMIHSVDTMKVLGEIDRQSELAGKRTKCLLQVHIAEEETKSGFSPEELLAATDTPVFSTFMNVEICGLMGMATFTDDMSRVRREFRLLAGLFERLKKGYFSNSKAFTELSMGMSGDYQVAIEEGSTMIRVGSFIFGERNKNQKI